MAQLQPCDRNCQVRRVVSFSLCKHRETALAGVAWRLIRRHVVVSLRHPSDLDNGRVQIDQSTGEMVRSARETSMRMSRRPVGAKHELSATSAAGSCFQH